MKAETVEQFKVLDYISANFNMGSIELKLIDRYTVEVTNQKGDTIQFRYDNGKVVIKE